MNVGGECVRGVRRELTDHGNMLERYVGVAQSPTLPVVSVGPMDVGG